MYGNAGEYRIHVAGECSLLKEERDVITIIRELGRMDGRDEDAFETIGLRYEGDNDIRE